MIYYVILPSEKNSVPAAAQQIPKAIFTSNVTVRSCQNNKSNPAAPMKPAIIVFERIVSLKKRRALIALKIVAKEKMTDTRPDGMSVVAL